MFDLYYIEDDPDIASAVKEYLEQKSIKVIIFETITQAKQALKNHVPTLILLDWNMPDGHGDSLCQWIRSNWKELPVIFITVRGDCTDIVSGFRNGADDYVVKPFELDVLYSRILAILRRTGNIAEQYLSCDGIMLEDEVDVFTLLVLAADILQELFVNTGSFIDIPELGEMMVVADLEWTMEAIMNLMKNCMEHNPDGTIHCYYAQNPLYTEIQIWDDGDGFAKEDIPHLFERFYRGHNAGEGGIGIGLSLAKEIVERQNGTIRAINKPDGGALFEIRFYSH